MNARDFDKFLSEVSTKPGIVILHPSIWNGYWSIHKVPRIASVVFRFLGRKLRSRKLYWIGLPLYWVYGLKEWSELEGIKPVEVSEEEWK
jgi:hypothetical protein